MSSSSVGFQAKSTLVTFNSAERDRTLWPDSHTYELYMTEPVENVTSVLPVDCAIPNTQYSIDDHNNVLDVTAGGTDYSVTLTNGNYTTAQLTTHLKARLDAVEGNVWTITDNSSSGGPRTFTFTNDTRNFTFNFSSGAATEVVRNGVAVLLGFPPGTDVTSTTLSLTGTLVYDLAGPRAMFIKLTLDGSTNVPNVNTGVTSTQAASSGGAGKVFAKVPIDVAQGDVKFIEFSHLRLIAEKVGTASLAGRVQRVKVELLQESGEVYNLNGAEMSLTAEFVSNVGGVLPAGYLPPMEALGKTAEEIRDVVVEIRDKEPEIVAPTAPTPAPAPVTPPPPPPSTAPAPPPPAPGLPPPPPPPAAPVEPPPTGTGTQAPGPCIPMRAGDALRPISASSSFGRRRTAGMAGKRRRF